MAIPPTKLVLIAGILLVALALQLFLSSPLSSSSLGALHFPAPSSAPPFPPNTKLQEVVKLGEGLLVMPEDVAVDGMGNLYTATRDGWVRRLLRNGSWENWGHVDTVSLLGLTITEAGDLFVCDAGKGLLEVGKDGVKVHVSQINGNPIRFADGVVAASDGVLYFTIASTKFDFRNWHLDMLDPVSTGQLVRYDPSTGMTTVLLDHLGVANGVALSPDQDFVVVCETWKYRCLKHWLEGDRKGQTEIFVDNLPGGPDNIKLAPDGSFWIALFQINPSIWLRLLYALRVPNSLIGFSPEAIERAIGLRDRATVVNVGSDGKIIRGFDDPTGKVMAYVTSALEFEGNLYIGSMHTNFLGKLPLGNPSA